LLDALEHVRNGSADDRSPLTAPAAAYPTT
jgi:hypothetical protein